MAKKDYYESLGVSRDVSDADLKKVFRRLAVKYHPDKNRGNKASEAKFKEVSEAYEVLSDSEKRRKYDAFGHAGVTGPGAGGFSPGQGGFGDIFGDIFEDFFGGGGQSRRGPQAERGADLQYNFEISFEDAAFGKEAKIRIPKWEPCSGCRGTGASSPSGIKTCAGCKGLGSVRYQQGFFSINRACPQCGGEGKIISSPCKKCRGEKRIHQDKTLSVKIPAGVVSGTRLRLSGEGEPGLLNGPSGDLYVLLSVRPHRIFTRKENNILCEANLSISQAALGGKIEVPTLKENVLLKIPPGTQTGEAFRIRGHGITHLGGRGIGDLIVRVRVKTPTKMNRRQRELMEEFSEIEGGSRDSEESLFAKVKNIFE